MVSINLQPTNIGLYFGFYNTQLRHYTWFQPSAAMSMRSALFWDFTQPRKIFSYRRFGKTCRSHLQASSRLQCRDWELSELCLHIPMRIRGVCRDNCASLWTTYVCMMLQIMQFSFHFTTLCISRHIGCRSATSPDAWAYLPSRQCGFYIMLVMKLCLYLKTNII